MAYRGIHDAWLHTFPKISKPLCPGSYFDAYSHIRVLTLTSLGKCSSALFAAVAWKLPICLFKAQFHYQPILDLFKDTFFLATSIPAKYPGLQVFGIRAESILFYDFILITCLTSSFLSTMPSPDRALKKCICTAAILLKSFVSHWSMFFPCLIGIQQPFFLRCSSVLLSGKKICRNCLCI